MRLYEIVIAVVQRDRSFEVFELLAEGIRQTAQAAAMHPKGMILFLNVTRGDQFNDRASCNAVSAFKSIAVFGGFGLILGSITYFSFATVSVAAHIALLQWISLLAGILNGCGFYAIRKQDDLYLNAKLEPEKLERLRRKLEPRRHRLVLKWIASILFCLLAGILSQGLKGAYSPWFDVIAGASYGAVAIAILLLALVVTEIVVLSNLQIDLTRDFERKKARKDLLTQIRA